jgi:hypothetical protein
MYKKPIPNIITVILLLVNFKHSFSQRKNSFLIDLGMTALAPKANSFNLNHESVFPDDYTYHLKFYPKFGIGLKLATGYEFNLITKNTSRLRFPILLSYRMVQERNKQFGEYYGGFSGKYFYGDREVNSTIQIATLSFGLNYTRQDYKKNEWTADVFLSGNINPYTKIHEIEDPVNCKYCKTKNEKYGYGDYALYYSVDFKLSKLYKCKGVLLGPFLSFNINTFYTRVYKITLLDYKFNNPVFNLTYYYHFLETGLKIKI